MLKKQNVLITTEYIQLQQLVKFVGLVDSGSEAKNFVFNNKISVNGVNENRRGKKLYPGDEITINNMCYVIEKE